MRVVSSEIPALAARFWKSVMYFWKPSLTLLECKTQFVYQSGDEEVLWEVQEITDEYGKKYKVKWAGTDPATGKPWAQSWVAKHDCMDDLVVEWKAKKKRQAAGKKHGACPIQHLDRLARFWHLV